MNPDLERFLQQFVSTALVRWWQSPKIKDIGRDWLLKNGIQNTIINGQHGYKKITG
jgi:antibiotic biosynthesis monooxygenase (ABM) superfamily enzyme